MLFDSVVQGLNPHCSTGQGMYMIFALAAAKRMCRLSSLVAFGLARVLVPWQSFEIFSIATCNIAKDLRFFTVILDQHRDRPVYGV